ncbi:hypothetical protein AWB75_03719 [Caballeronia catudaia]|uniref:Uncharacterized protein n=1 Tax=Caballeronia catudaia TaxID=1777136 RepID=A0A158BMP9_9BURK|nr:hypothetical protein AWB75_03719 [Caballeronia catudaia]
MRLLNLLNEYGSRNRTKRLKIANVDYDLRFRQENRKAFNDLFALPFVEPDEALTGFQTPRNQQRQPYQKTNQ